MDTFRVTRVQVYVFFVHSIPYFPQPPLLHVIIGFIIVLIAHTCSSFPCVTPTHLFLIFSHQPCVFTSTFSPLSCQIVQVPAFMLPAFFPVPVPCSLSTLLLTCLFLCFVPRLPVPLRCSCSFSPRHPAPVPACFLAPLSSLISCLQYLTAPLLRVICPASLHSLLPNPASLATMSRLPCVTPFPVTERCLSHLPLKLVPFISESAPACWFPKP